MKRWEEIGIVSLVLFVIFVFPFLLGLLDPVHEVDGFGQYRVAVHEKRPVLSLKSPGGDLGHSKISRQADGGIVFTRYVFFPRRGPVITTRAATEEEIALWRRYFG